MLSSRHLVAPPLFLLIGALAACSVDTVTFCETWAAEACDQLATCCQPGGLFERDLCAENMLLTCQNFIPRTESIDDDAARACLARITSCADVGRPAPTDAAYRQTCAAIGGASRALGADCGSDPECEPAGDFAVCWRGVGDMITRGRCVAVSLDDTTCSFDGDAGTLHLCSADAYCTVPGYQIPGTPPDDLHPWMGRCEPRIAPGQSCVDPGTDDGVLPCQTGFYCHVLGSNAARCEPQKPAGAPCDGAAGIDECEAGLRCEAPDGFPARLCLVPVHDGPFCTPPTRCGDGACTDGEMGNCPADCGVCGDDVCEPAETSESCPVDCGPQSSCRACACKFTQSLGGCRDLCDEILTGTGTADLCNGAPALPQCAECVQNHCGDPANCTF